MTDMDNQEAQTLMNEIFESRERLEVLRGNNPFNFEIHKNLVFWDDENGAAPVANQLRYAADHFLRYKVKGDVTELIKCHGHLKRAEFDAMELICVKVDNAFESLRLLMGNYMHLLQSDVPSWKQYQKKILEHSRRVFDFRNIDYGNRDKIIEADREYVSDALRMLTEYEKCFEVIINHKTRLKATKHVRNVLMIFVVLSAIAGFFYALFGLIWRLLDFFSCIKSIIFIH